MFVNIDQYGAVFAKFSVKSLIALNGLIAAAGKGVCDRRIAPDDCKLTELLSALRIKPYIRLVF